MASPRAGHTATLLPDGKVLVSADHYGFHATAEVYDPATGTWSATGSMVSSRHGHTATLLPDGKVLVSGGYTISRRDHLYLATAEVYDPATGTWSATGSMASPRSSHTATLLPDGKVLVSGGYDGYGTFAKAEVYDPAMGTWRVVHAMASSRSGHIATLLPNGEVLVTEGDLVEVYDSASPLWPWRTTGSMASPRRYHTATLLTNGKVLVSGGSDNNSALATAELYTP
jgi:WD40 repeat protein